MSAACPAVWAIWGATAQGHNELTKGGFPDTDYVRVSRYGRLVLVVLV